MTSAAPASRCCAVAECAPQARAAAKAPAAKTATPSAKAAAVSDDVRFRMIGEAAYYRAEKHHFRSDPVRDWIEAEGDIAKLLESGKV